MFKTLNSKQLSNFVNNASGKITSIGQKTMESATVKKTVATVSTSSKQISSYTAEASKKAVAAGKKTAESEKVKSSVQFLGNSSKEVLTESRKIASNVIFNVFMVALIFLSLNSIFMIYGIYGSYQQFLLDGSNAGVWNSYSRSSILCFGRIQVLQIWPVQNWYRHLSPSSRLF